MEPSEVHIDNLVSYGSFIGIVCHKGQIDGIPTKAVAGESENIVWGVYAETIEEAIALRIELFKKYGPKLDFEAKNILPSGLSWSDAQSLTLVAENWATVDSTWLKVQDIKRKLGYQNELSKG